MLVFCRTICDFIFCAAEREKPDAKEGNERKLIGGKNARPQPDLLPREKEQQPRIFSIVEDCLANPIAGFSVKAANVSPSPSVFASLRRDCKSEPRRSAA
jgi:hypothetical protein